MSEAEAEVKFIVEVDPNVWTGQSNDPNEYLVIEGWVLLSPNPPKEGVRTAEGGG